ALVPRGGAFPAGAADTDVDAALARYFASLHPLGPAGLPALLLALGHRALLFQRPRPVSRLAPQGRPRALAAPPPGPERPPLSPPPALAGPRLSPGGGPPGGGARPPPRGPPPPRSPGRPPPRGRGAPRALLLATESGAVLSGRPRPFPPRAAGARGRALGATR